MAKAQTTETPPKPRKEWRDPEGSIIRKTVKRRDSKGGLKDVEFIFARVRYTHLDGKRREKKRLAESIAHTHPIVPSRTVKTRRHSG